MLFYRYESLVGTIGKKFTKKRYHNATEENEDSGSGKPWASLKEKLEKKPSDGKVKKKKKDKKGFMIPSDD